MYNFKRNYVMPIVGNASKGTTQRIQDNFNELNNVIKSEINIDNDFKLSDQLFINVSHEIRTPLNIIYSATQLIERYLKMNDEDVVNKIALNVNSIKQNSFRLMKVLNNIVDLHEIEIGLFKLNYNCVNIIELVEDVVQSVSKHMRDRQLSFVFDTDSEEEYMMVDTVNIERVLLNILSNAVKFSYPQGKISVDLTVKENVVEIEISDNGIGIEKKHLRKIFDRFGQVDKSLTRKAEGSGIGLKLSNALIEAHGGSICVFSKPQRGSTFIVKLPRKQSDSIYTLYSNKVINYDSLSEMIKIEFSDIEDMQAKPNS